jgi:hypothetical protein
MNEIANSLEQLCKRSDQELVRWELLWQALGQCEDASLGADAAYEVLKSLSVEARGKLAAALRDMLEGQPDALKRGYEGLHSVFGIGALANVSHAWRTIPPEWMKLVARLGEGHASSGLTNGGDVIRGKTDVILASDRKRDGGVRSSRRTAGPSDSDRGVTS